MKLVELIGIHVETESGTPIMLLRETEAPNRVLPVFIGPVEANSIALAMSGKRPPRPMTHDLMTNVLDKLGGHVDAVEVTELQDGAFHAALVLLSPGGSHRIDTRPSDAIALAVRNGAPIYAAEAVLDEAGTVLVDPDADDSDALDPEQIDAQVAAFRTMLDDLDPADLREAPEADPDDDTPESAD